MDIYSFINSADIAKHCRELNHQFTPVEMAYLIRKSEKHTIPEKHQAYKELIETTPDMEVAVDGWKSNYNSLHSFLEEHMQIENKYLQCFYQDEPNSIYSYEYDRLGNEMEKGCLHKNYNACYQELKENVGDSADILDIRVTKQWTLNAENNFPNMLLHITKENVPQELELTFLEDEEREINNTWMDMFPVMPTPFQKGDILVYKSRTYEEVLVIDWIPYWKDKDICPEVSSPDRWTANTAAYRQDEDGSIRLGTAPVYLNLEYYNGELKGNLRILKAISDYLKGKLNFEALIGAYNYLQSDALVENKEQHLYALLGDSLFAGKDEITEVKKPTSSGIYKYINSNAIAEYCQKIGHQFTPIESAYLIHASERHTISQKHDAWKKIIEETPDMELKERPWTPQFGSFHNFLQQYMQIENKYIDLFYHDEPDCIYSYEYLHHEDSEYSKDDGLYKDFSTCYEKMMSSIDESDKIIDFRISKQWLNTTAESGIRKITLCITADNVPVMLWTIQGLMDNEESNIFLAFDGLWIEIPTPFEKGDILVDCSKYNHDTAPFVLDSIPYWINENRTKTMLEYHRENGDSSDMFAQVYSQDWDGILCQGCGPNYLQMDYYTDDFTDSEKFLLALSAFLKDKIDIETLMYAYDFIKYEHFADDERCHLEEIGGEVYIKAGVKNIYEEKGK